MSLSDGVRSRVGAGSFSAAETIAIQRAIGLVVVDRSAVPTNLPNYVGRWVYPEFASHGPAEYRLSELIEYYHERTRRSLPGSMRGDDFLDHLVSTGRIDRCLNLQDGLAIANLGLDAYLSRFRDAPYFSNAGYDQDYDIGGPERMVEPEPKSIYLWKSAYYVGVGRRSIEVPRLMAGKMGIHINYGFSGIDTISVSSTLTPAMMFPG